MATQYVAAAGIWAGSGRLIAGVTHQRAHFTSNFSRLSKLCHCDCHAQIENTYISSLFGIKSNFEFQQEDARGFKNELCWMAMES